MDKKIASVIILYNPVMEVINNILSYQKKLARLYIIDNTQNPDQLITDRIKKFKSNKYFPNYKNNGISQALNCAARYAMNDGFNWLLTMDQDSSFPPGELKKYLSLVKIIPDLKNTAIIAPNNDFNCKFKTEKSPDFIERDIVLTSGSLLNLSLFNAVGGFDEKLFIDEVDHDYCLRARLRGYKIIEIKNVVLNHHHGIPQKILRKGKEIDILTHSPLRMYYITRNNLYLWKKYYKSFPYVIKNRIKCYLRMLVNIALYEDKKIEKMYYIFKGIAHFIIGRYGK